MYNEVFPENGIDDGDDDLIPITLLFSVVRIIVLR
jgi:hypothetical protein